MSTVLLIFHIIFAGTWISLGIANMIIAGQAAKQRGTFAELPTMKIQALLGRVLGSVSGIGILLTGGAYVGMMHLGWFPFGTLNWLAIKQVDFVILLILSFAVMMPRGKKIDAMIASEMAGPNATKGASAELRKAMGLLKSIGGLMMLLVLLNIILGEWKPDF
jgi:hypothetical protein